MNSQHSQRQGKRKKTNKWHAFAAARIHKCAIYVQQAEMMWVGGGWSGDCKGGGEGEASLKLRQAAAAPPLLAAPHCCLRHRDGGMPTPTLAPWL